MGNFWQLGQRRFFVDELLAVEITKLLAVKANAKICSKDSFPVLLVDTSECVVQFTAHTPHNNINLLISFSQSSSHAISLSFK